ncbi:hypothetical protein H1164_17385 [Thermoactinomyces daqus]|uniref:Immunity protein Imm1 n=1 Tax=Thermoactinomyces daqus TaxID=1329516 RepID=A0A7W2AK61_9BACL|nr:hypothetical protein [Thermoactinomyces daqus]MBA4544603.1 hypothetical protein [Thermoactinomyces daqus]
MKWELCIEHMNHLVHNPDWDRIHEVIQQMDGKTITNFVLDPADDEGASLLCGGGDVINGEKRYKVEYYCEDGSGYCLINPEESADKEYELTIRVPDVQLAKHCVKQEEVIKAFEYFYKTGKRNPELLWEEY